MVTYKIPPYFADDGGAVPMHGSHSTKSRMGRDWPSGKGREDKDNWAGYDENFLPPAVKHKIKEEGMKLDYYGRDKAGTSHYFRPLRYHGDGVVPQWGPNGGVPKGREALRATEARGTRREEILRTSRGGGPGGRERGVEGGGGRWVREGEGAANLCRAILFYKIIIYSTLGGP